MLHTRAVVLVERNQPPILDDVVIRAPVAGEVLVEMRVSGVCHTDLAAVRDARHHPVLLGHEGAGVVAAVGSGVTHVAPGDHVVINWQPKCGRCRRCQTGRADLCEGIAGTLTPHVFWRDQPLGVLLNAGTFCPWVMVPAAGAVRIRRDLDFAEAALLGCAVATGVGAALFTARIQAGDTVAVLGVGGVGLNVVQGAREAGAAKIAAVDLDAAALETARAFGATATFDARDPALVDKIRALSGGRGVEFAFEVVGSPEVMRTGLALLGRGGELVLVGAAARDAQLQFAPRAFLSCQQVIRGSIYGNIQPARHLPMFADWCCEGRLQVKALITRRIGLAEVPGLFGPSPPARGIRTVVDFPAAGAV